MLLHPAILSALVTKRYQIAVGFLPESPERLNDLNHAVLIQVFVPSVLRALLEYAELEFEDQQAGL